MNTKQFLESIPDEDAALDWLRHKLYPAEIYCVKCQKPTKHHRVKTRKVYACQFCGHQISPTRGTIFHKSPTPLRTWFYVICRIAETKGEISARQVQRETGVTYKTAWRMVHAILEKLNNR